MIPWEVWIPQIVGYARLVEEGVTLRSAWIENDYSDTSVTDFDEMYVQIFDDLAADEFLGRLPEFVESERGVAIKGFLDGIKIVDEARQQDKSLLDPSVLMDSFCWETLKEAARALIRAYDKEVDL